VADCPKCGRQLTVAGSCIKCGTLNDRSRWYAIADDTEKKDKPPAQAKRAAPTARRPPSSAARKDWYQAAGMEVPDDQPIERAMGPVPGEVPIDTKDHHAWAEVSRGRKDPPFGWIAAGMGVAVCIGAMVLYARHGEPPADETAVDMPFKNIPWNHSYGYKVEPPEGFKQQRVDMPEFARGVHGELTRFISFHQPKSGIEAYYFGEVKENTTLDAYAQLSVSDLGALTPLTAFPEGIKAYPTKGYLIDMGARKALVYVSFAKPDRYLTVWILAPSSTFAGLQSQVEAAARAFTIVEPDGPRPGTTFAPQ
jgi:hypothetical protein